MAAGLFDDLPELSDRQVQGMDSTSVHAPHPLADRLRPLTLSDILGQEHILAADGPLGRQIAAGRIPSLILWGPPGCGKTTMARALAQHTDLVFQPLSAVFSGVADLRKVFEKAKDNRAKLGRGTLLFVDEIHRFNKAQQDSFLPFVEDGTVVLVGATTENPSFELNAALMSRCQVMVLKRLDDAALEGLLARAEDDISAPLPVDVDAREALKAMADGDGRSLLNMVEAIYAMAGEGEIFSSAQLSHVVQRRAPVFDKSGEGHYNLISALHKSLRGSDPDAALYWLARMLDGGEDPAYILRRLTRFAVEDIGLADPNALTQAIATWEAYDRLGSPEGDLALSYLVVYLGTAPKSIGAYAAHKAAMVTAKKTGSLAPPMHILNAPTKLMKELGYNAGYQYDPETKDGFSGQNYFPDGMKRQKFYHPFERGFERDITKRLAYWDRLRAEKADKADIEDDDL